MAVNFDNEFQSNDPNDQPSNLEGIDEYYEKQRS